MLLSRPLRGLYPHHPENVNTHIHESNDMLHHK
jgi:hypothetical protein